MRLPSWLRRRKAAPRRATLEERNHISLPAIREPPPALLRELREIDPTVDLHYVGQGFWALGSVKPNRARREIAGKMLENRRRAGFFNYVRRVIPELALQGFGIIGWWQIEGEPDGRIVKDFRYSDWCYRRGEEPDWDSMEMRRQVSDDVLMQEVVDRVKHDEGIFWRARHTGYSPAGPTRRRA